MSENNDIFKYLCTAYQVQTQDMIDIFQSVGIEVSRSKVTNLCRDNQHPKFSPLSGKKLKAFLLGLLRRLNLQVDGVNLRTLMDALLIEANVTSTGDVRLDAIAIRDKKKREVENPC